MFKVILGWLNYLIGDIFRYQTLYRRISDTGTHFCPKKFMSKICSEKTKNQANVSAQVSQYNFISFRVK